MNARLFARAFCLCFAHSKRRLLRCNQITSKIETNCIRLQPRKPPKYIPKKAKKQKEKPEENKEELQDQTNDPQDPNDSTSTETQQINNDGEKTFGRTDLSQGMNSTEGSMMESDGKSVDVKDKNRIVIAENNTIWPRGLKGKHNDTINDKKESQGGEDQSQEGMGL